MILSTFIFIRVIYNFDHLARAINVSLHKYQFVQKVLKRAQTKTDTMNLNKPFFLLTFHMKTHKKFSESAH
jgi:hypothetical protein